MEQKRAASADTVYRIGSITKQFTALMLLQLVEQGKVRLTDPVEKYLSEISKVPKHRPDAPPITLVQLATMTSGLSREPTGPSDHSAGPVSQLGAEGPDVAAADDLCVRAGHAVSLFQHRLRIAWHCSGSCRRSVVHELRRAEDPDAARHDADGVRADSNAIRANVARGYSRSRDGKVDWRPPTRELEGRGYRVPNGASMSTVGDLAKFVVVRARRRAVDYQERDAGRELRARLLSCERVAGSGYGLGFQATRRGTSVAMGHGGSTAGFLTAALIDRASKTGIIVLRNVDGGQGRLNPSNVAIRALEVVVAARTKPVTESRQ